MTRFATSFAAAALVLTLAGTAQAAAPAVTDLTPAVQSAVPNIDRLQVFEVGGVVVLRGRTYDRARAEEAGRLALSLGYTRVANLIQILERPDDQAIERAAERELSRHRSLDGCQLRIDSDQGIVKLAGTVTHELQKDMAINVLRNVDGVREVRADLTRD